MTLFSSHQHICKYEAPMSIIFRTLGNLMDLYWSYFESEADKSKAKEYGNVIHPCMIRYMLFGVHYFEI